METQLTIEHLAAYLPYGVSTVGRSFLPPHDPESVGVVCECCLPAVEPDYECADWQAEWGKQPDWIKEEWNY
jgi:hypothetical protein